MLAPLALAFTLAASPNVASSDSVRSDREIRLAALRHVADVKRCYEREGLTRDPGLTGTLDVSVTVLATGEVSEASITSSDLRGLGAREVATCLTTVIRNWRFDRGPYVVETIVFPFRFSPTTGVAPRIATS
jgi:outer membrane biosynthesis protein TonB